MPKDKMVWSFSKDGRFSVRSAYRVATSMGTNDDVSRIGSHLPSTCWKEMWKMKIVPKISIFLWQACNEALPTCANLIKRGMDVDPICKLCGDDIETQSHLLLQCRETSQIWQRCPLRVQNIQSMGYFQNLLWSSLKNHPTEYNELLAVVAWCIWTTRNKVFFENRQWSCYEVMDKVQRLWSEIHVERRKKNKPRSSANNDPKAWQPPPEGWLKVDSDIAVLGPLMIGMGFVIRKHGGEVIFAGRDETAAVGDSTLLEGLGVRFALLQAVKHGLNNLMVGCDNEILIKSINRRVTPGVRVEAIIEDIKDIASGIENVVFTFNRREFNYAAHYMAKGPSGLYCNTTPCHITPYV